MMITNLQQDKCIHSMNRGINALYFSQNIQETEFGYSFFAKHSKVKNKHVVMADRHPPSSDGEIIRSVNSQGYSKASEIVYHIPSVFDRSLYKNRKAYQNRILSPEKLTSKLGIDIREARLEDLQEIDALHSLWCEKKLENPKVHRISFSSVRYIRCVREAFGKDDFRVLVAVQEGKIVGARVVACEGTFLFDAAFFVAFWDQSQLSEAVNVSMLKFLLAQGFQYLNTGIATGTLKAYKQHFPHTEIFAFRKNQAASEVTLDGFFGD